MNVPDAKRLKALEEENGRLKRVVAALVDDFTREAPALEVDVSLSADHVARVLDRLIATRSINPSTVSLAPDSTRGKGHVRSGAPRRIPKSNRREIGRA